MTSKKRSGGFGGRTNGVALTIGGSHPVSNGAHKPSVPAAAPGMLGRGVVSRAPPPAGSPHAAHLVNMHRLLPLGPDATLRCAAVLQLCRRNPQLGSWPCSGGLRCPDPSSACPSLYERGARGALSMFLPTGTEVQQPFCFQNIEGGPAAPERPSSSSGGPQVAEAQRQQRCCCALTWHGSSTAAPVPHP